MKTAIRPNTEHGGTILVYFIMMAIFATAIASLSVYVSQTTGLAKRRGDMVAAQQFAEGGAVAACVDLRKAYTNSFTAFPDNLITLCSYTVDSSVSNSAQRVYTRTISAPFTNQT